jgi:DNA-binding PadR family transcriptional regulator
MYSFKDSSMAPQHQPNTPLQPLSPLEFHVLLVLAPGQLYGYAIKKGVEEQSLGAVSPEIGSLYRALARLMERGWVEESRDPPREEYPQRGKPRKYYYITARGLEAARAETRRLRGVLKAAEVSLPEVAR